MRILLAHNSTYFPSTGGGDKSNRLLMEALAERGHQVRVITRVERFGEEAHQHLVHQLEQRGIDVDLTDPNVVRMDLHGVDVRTLSRSPHLRAFFQAQVNEFDPDIIITSTDDPGQLLIDVALKAPRARVVYLVRATIAVPFGPDASMTNPAKTDVLRRMDGVVGVSHYVANYVRQWSGIDAIHVPISLLEPGDYPLLGRWESPYVAMVNPCAVKGIDIFTQLAERFPQQPFAAIPAWGTNQEDLDSLHRHPNIKLLPPVDNIDRLLEHSKVMLVPSVWAEARSRIVLEAMSRGIPVLASDVGGLSEAKLGVPYLLPVNPVTRYRPTVDANMVPVAEVPPQDVTPWAEALGRLLQERDHWEALAAESRRAALDYAANLNVLPFESFLQDLAQRPKRSTTATATAAPSKAEGLSEEKRRLLALRLKQKSGQPAPAATEPWFPQLAESAHAPLRLFCFPFAGGGVGAYRGWQEALGTKVGICAVRLPGREARSNELPIDDMGLLIEDLLRAIEPHTRHPYAFFGHSMGAAIAFELTRALRRAGLPLPAALYASGARAPQFRLHHKPGPEPSREEFVAELQRLGGIPPEVLAHAELMRLVLPVMQADARLYRHYVYQPDEPLTLPLWAYGGTSDPNVTLEHLEAWRQQTTSPFHLRQFPGGHFFLREPAFLRQLAADLP